MTVFPDGTKEALHGHNYTTQLTVTLKDSSFEKTLPFSYFKTHLKKLCNQWDEKVLIAAKCPWIKIQSDTPREIELTLCGKRYVFPREDVELLPVQNVTAEALAQEFCRRLVSEIQVLEQIKELSLTIEESPGQGGTAYWAPSAPDQKEGA